MSTELLANVEGTLEWLAVEEAELIRQADALDTRLEIIREMRSRLTGARVDASTRAPRKRRTTPPETATSVADQDRTAADLLGAAA